MAKVSGPLFSVEARGKFGGALVFALWKGRQYVRKLVTPANPRTANQEAARNNIRVAGALQKWVNANTQSHAEITGTDKAALISAKPGDQAWNGYLVDQVIGAGALNITASDAQWAALSGPEQVAWDAAADGLTTLMPSVSQTVAGGGAGTPKTSGNVFYNYEYALFVAGLVNAPDAVPPVYA